MFDAGVYSCHASNLNGKATCSANAVVVQVNISKSGNVLIDNCFMSSNKKENGHLEPNQRTGGFPILDKNDISNDISIKTLNDAIVKSNSNKIAVHHVRCLNLNLEKRVPLSNRMETIQCCRDSREHIKVSEGKENLNDDENILKKTDEYLTTAEILERKQRRRDFLESVRGERINNLNFENELTLDFNDLCEVKQNHNSNKISVNGQSLLLTDENQNINLNDNRKLLRLEKTKMLQEENLLRNNNTEIQTNKLVRAPRFTPDISTNTVMDGNIAKFRFKITADPMPETVKWMRNGKEVSEHCPYVISDYDSKTGEVTLLVPEVFPEDAGDYVCIACNQFGMASISSTLIVEAYEYIPDAEESITSADETGSLSVVSAFGVPSLKDAKGNFNRSVINGNDIVGISDNVFHDEVENLNGKENLKSSQEEATFDEDVNSFLFFIKNKWADNNKTPLEREADLDSFINEFKKKSNNKSSNKLYDNVKISENDKIFLDSNPDKKKLNVHTFSNCEGFIHDDCEYSTTDDLYLEVPEVPLTEGTNIESELIKLNVAVCMFPLLSHVKTIINRPTTDNFYKISVQLKQCVIPSIVEHISTVLVASAYTMFKTEYLNCEILSPKFKIFDESYLLKKVMPSVLEKNNSKETFRLYFLQSHCTVSQETYSADVVEDLFLQQVKKLKPKFKLQPIYELCNVFQNYHTIRCALNFCNTTALVINKYNEIDNIEHKSIAIYGDLCDNRNILHTANVNNPICRNVPCYYKISSEITFPFYLGFEENQINLAPTVVDPLEFSSTLLNKYKKTQFETFGAPLDNSKLNFDYLKLLRNFRTSVSSDPGIRNRKKTYSSHTLHLKPLRRRSRSFCSLDSHKSNHSSRKVSIVFEYDHLRPFCSESVLTQNYLTQSQANQISNPISYLSFGSSLKRSFSDLDSKESSLSIISHYEKTFSKFDLPNNLVSLVAFNRVHPIEEYIPIQETFSLKFPDTMKCKHVRRNKSDCYINVDSYQVFPTEALLAEIFDTDLNVEISTFGNNILDYPNEPFQKLHSQSKVNLLAYNMPCLTVDTNYREVIEEKTVPTSETTTFKSNLASQENLPPVENVLPMIISHLQNKQVLDGSQVELWCQIKSQSVVSVTWFLDGLEIQPNDEVVLTQENENIFKLSICDVLPEDEGLYCLKATNEFGECHTTAYLTVLDPSIDLSILNDENDAIYGDANVNHEINNVEYKFESQQSLESNTDHNMKNEIFNDDENDDESEEMFSCEEEHSEELTDTSSFEKQYCTDNNCSSSLHNSDNDQKTLPSETYFETVSKNCESSSNYNTHDNSNKFKLELSLKKKQLNSESDSHDDPNATLTSETIITNENVLKNLQKIDLVKLFDMKRTVVMPTKSPKFLEKLKLKEVFEGSILYLECFVAGVPEPDITWFQDGRKLTQQSTINNNDDDNDNNSNNNNNNRIKIFNKNGLCTLTIDQSRLEDRAQYMCVARNDKGTDRTWAEVFVKRLQDGLNELVKEENYEIEVELHFKWKGNAEEDFEVEDRILETDC